jgi:hypothetical protein
MCVLTCRFAPISAEWLGGNGRREKDNMLVDSSSALHEEQLNLSAMLLASSVLDIETERVRAAEKTAESADTALDEDTEPQDERSLLYKPRPAPSPSAPLGEGDANLDVKLDVLESGQSAVVDGIPVRLPQRLGASFEASVKGKVPASDPLEYIRLQMQEQVRFQLFNLIFCGSSLTDRRWS